MNKCGGCGKFLSGGATCPKCRTVYHRQCVNLTSGQSLAKTWLCPACVASVPRKDSTNTPLEESVEPESEESPQQECYDDQQQCGLLEEIRALRAEMTGLRKDFGSLREEVRDEMKELRCLYLDCNKMINGFSEQIESQASRIAALESICKESKNLEMEVAFLKRELGEKDQLALHNDLEISGVTEHSGENITHITSILMTKVGAKVDARDIVDVRRAGPPRVGQDGKPVARPIVLRLTRRAVHQQILLGARTRRNITTADLEVAGAPRPIYINERLTKENRLLFMKARSLCKQHDWKYAWTRDGKVLIRQADGKTAFRIRGDNDFNSVFK